MNGERSAAIPVDTVLNCRGMRCPLPVIYTRKALATMETGQVVQVVATDPDALEDMTEFSHRTGHELLRHAEEAGDFIFFIRKS
jgi:tRNA 2-thiouridine synthesizing protein A